MAKIADILGLAAGEAEPMVAVVRCNGTCANRPRINQYDGAKSCAIAASLYGGETGCSYGCLGCGDCVAACQFDAIHMNPETGLPEVDEAKCTACGACVKACPKAIIEIRPQGKKSRRVYVSCVNKDKGDRKGGRDFGGKRDGKRFEKGDKRGGFTVLRLHASDASFPHGLASADVCVREASILLEKYFHR